MCGVCGVFNHPDAAFLAYLMTFKHQHRGQESAGVAVINGSGINIKKGLGLVDEVFDRGKLFSKDSPEHEEGFFGPVELRLKGNAAIGHVRYSTSGDPILKDAQLKNAQPLSPVSIGCEIALGAQLAISYNGNLANAEILKRELIEAGEVFEASSDTEIILKFLEKPSGVPLEERIRNFSERAVGSYSMAILERTGSMERLVAVRDSIGFMPLVLGELDGAFLLASETRAFDMVNGRYMREIEPGEILSISSSGLHSTYLPKKEPALCVFQYVYFTMPDSIVFGQYSGMVKKNLGRELAREDIDFISMIKKGGLADDYIVAPIPNSGNIGALGYAQQSGLNFEFGIARDNYVGRLFIQNNQFSRELGASLKHNPIGSFIRDKRVILVDDSIVRGTTIKDHVKKLREKGAAEVHVRIFSPPYENPCFYGIDTPSWNELAAANMSVEEIRVAIGADSIRYLSIDGLLRAAENNGNRYCTACFTGQYPTEIFTSRAAQPQRPAVLQKA